MSSTRVGPRAIEFLEAVRRSTNDGETRSKATLIDPSLPQRTREGQQHIVDDLIRRGLMRNLNSPDDSRAYFSRRGAALIVTPLGREILDAAYARGRL